MTKIKLLKLNNTVKLPKYQTEGSSGMDLCLCLPGMGDSLAPGETKTYGLGFALELPAGLEGQIRSRSSLASMGLVVTNSPGTIDSDYRGEIKVTLTNYGKTGSFFVHGDRVAQLVFAPIVHVELTETDSLKSTKRGKFGFGSTGIK